MFHCDLFPAVAHPGGRSSELQGEDHQGARGLRHPAAGLRADGRRGLRTGRIRDGQRSAVAAEGN